MIGGVEARRGMATVFDGVREWVDWIRARPATRKLYKIIDRIEDDPIPTATDGNSFEPEASYFSVRIVEMHLQNAGEYFRNFLPIAVTLSEFKQGGQSRSSPFFLNNDRLKQALGAAGEHVGAIRMENVYALRYVPVNADGLSLFCGLFRVTHHDFAAALLDLLSEIGGQLATPGIGQGAEVAKAVYAQIGKVIGMTGVEFRFGHLDGSFLSRGSGYRVFAGASEKDCNLDDLAMRKGKLCHLNERGEERPVTEFDYCVIAIERLSSRAIGGLLTTLPLHQQWGKVIPHLTANRLDDAEPEFGKLQAEILLSPDLTEEDRLVALALYQKKWVDVRNRIQAVGATRAPVSESLRKNLIIETEERRSAGKNDIAELGDILAFQFGPTYDYAGENEVGAVTEAETRKIADALTGKRLRAPISSELATMLTAARLRSRTGYNY
jgi:hypothetical protein